MNDDSPIPTTRASQVTMTEFVIAVILLLCLTAAQLVATRGRALFNQMPWLDEVHTAMIVSDPDPWRWTKAISTECVDRALPLYHPALRWLHIQTLPRIRTVSFVSTLVALLGIYWLLRGSFARGASAAGTLTVWTTPFIVYQAFQARFYMPWFAAVICLAVALRWEKQTSHKVLAGVAVAIASILACMLHGVGLFAAGLVVGAECLVDSRPFKRRLVAILPAITGPLAVAASIPVLISQSHSMAVKSWLTANPIRLLYSMLAGVLPGLPMALVVLGLWATFVINRFRSRTAPHALTFEHREIPFAPVASLSALALLPLILFVLSMFTEPLLLPRYALVTTACAAPAVAYAATYMRPAIVFFLCLTLSAETGAELSRRVREAASFSKEVTDTIEAIRAQPDVPALFEQRHQQYPVVWTARDLVNRCFLVDFEPGPNQLPETWGVFERDYGRKFQRLYGWPRVMPWEQVMSQKRFILVPMLDESERVGKRFAGFYIRRLERNRYELTRE